MRTIPTEGQRFQVFSEEEQHLLLRAMLEGQGLGRSARACALSLSGGEHKGMLRYQNKYRNLLRGNEEAVHRVIAELRAEGRACLDPYATPPRRGRRKVRPDQPVMTASEAALSSTAATAFIPLYQLLQSYEKRLLALEATAVQASSKNVSEELVEAQAACSLLEDQPSAAQISDIASL